MKFIQPIEIEKELLGDDGTYPNNQELPLLIYRQVFDLHDGNGKSEEYMKQHFASNNWSNAWTNGIHDYHHYHSNTHEVLGISTGRATVQFGGPAGLIADLDQGDVVIIPAGVAHKCLHGKKGFACVGAYPMGAEYDMRYGSADERKDAIETIKKVPVPASDPVFGTKDGVPRHWKSQLLD